MPNGPLLSVLLPTRNAAKTLAATLSKLAPIREAFPCEVIVADGGSTDDTVAVAESFGAKVVRLPPGMPPGRGQQLRNAALAARGEWLFFLHADSRPGTGWSEAVRTFTAEPENYHVAAVFRLALDSARKAARRIERLVAWRCRVFGLPYGDQGLLLSRALYDAVGGFAPIPIMEDVEIVRRLGKDRLAFLDAPLVTSAERYEKGGYWRRPFRNLVCLALYFLGASPARLRRFYG